VTKEGFCRFDIGDGDDRYHDDSKSDNEDLGPLS
jgi:hypothetical protein